MEEDDDPKLLINNTRWKSANHENTHTHTKFCLVGL